jgi:Putative Ig domain
MRSTNYFNKRGAANILATLLMLLAFVSAGFAQLARVGPVDPFDGFPQWYQDKNGIALEHCIPNPAELAAGLCLLLPGNMTFPVVFPTSYPDESFYFAADATIALPGGGTAKLVIGHEGAFATGPVVPGDQIVFSRVRFVVDIPQPGGNYKIISPYLEKDFSNVPAGKRAIFFTEDVGLAPGDFNASLNGRVAPYLRPSAVRGGDPLPFIVVDGKSYIGDAATLAPVTGSPLGAANNVFRIEGPNIGGPGINFIETEAFTVMGRVHAAPIASPTTIDRATYVRDANSGWIDVFATATPGIGKPDPALSVGTGPIAAVLMAKSLPKFYGQLTLANSQSVPATVTVTNNADVPPSVFTTTLVDEVNIRRAEYDGTAHRLTIQADSGDKIGNPVLVLDGAHPAALDATGLLIVDNLIVPPPYVTIRSSLGGSATSIVSAPASFAASPSLLLATAISDAQVQLNWTDTSTNETGFRIDRSLDSAFSTGVRSFTVPANTTTYVDITTAGNTNYFYRVIAFTAVGASGPSNTASVTTPNPTQPPTITNPGNQTSLDGSSISLQIAATDHAGGHNPLTFTATGLPIGLSLNASTGLITGGVSALGTSNVIVAVSNGPFSVVANFT